MRAGQKMRLARVELRAPGDRTGGASRRERERESKLRTVTNFRNPYRITHTFRELVHLATPRKLAHQAAISDKPIVVLSECLLALIHPLADSTTLSGAEESQLDSVDVQPANGFKHESTERMEPLEWSLRPKPRELVSWFVC